MQLIGQHPEKVLDPRMRMEASLAEAGAVDEDCSAPWAFAMSGCAASP